MGRRRLRRGRPAVRSRHRGGAQIGQPITDGEFVTAMVLILAAIALGRLSFALEDAQERRSPYGKIDRRHARNPEYPEDQERGA